MPPTLGDMGTLPFGTRVDTWIEEAVPELRARGIPVCEFTQNAGEVVYIPSGWVHAVFNVADSVGVSAELVEPLMHPLRRMVWESSQRAGRADKDADVDADVDASGHGP